MINYQLIFLSLLQKMRNSPENSKILIMALSSWGTAPIQEPIRSCLIRKNDAPITQEIPRDLGALCQELGSKVKY